jgi:hypothetical protein
MTRFVIIKKKIHFWLEQDINRALKFELDHKRGVRCSAKCHE